MTGECSGGTVHVVVANFDSDPHPHVEGVYSSEGDAEKHRKEIVNSTSPHAPIAWKVEECEVMGSA